MKTRFAIKPIFRPIVINEEAVFLLMEQEYIVLQGVVVTRLVELLLEGPQSAEHLTQRMADMLSAEEACDLLMQLKHDGFLIEHLPGVRSHAALFWSRFDVPHERVTQVLQHGRVALKAIGLDPEPMQAALEDLHLHVAPEGDMTIVLAEDFLHPSLAAYNAEATQPWLLVKPVGLTFWMTLFLPGHTPCWACLAHRLRQNRRAEVFLQERLGMGSLPNYAHGPASYMQACRRAAAEAAQGLLEQPNPNLVAALLTIDSATWAEERHVITKRPLCPVCGAPAQDTPPAPSVLQSRAKSPTLESGCRTLPAAEAFSRYSHLIDRYTGVVRNLRRVTTTSQEVTYTYLIQNVLAHRIKTFEELRGNELNQSGGKGRTAAQAKASALFEALERLSGIWRPEIHRIRSSFRALGDKAVHPYYLLLFSEAQYRNRDAWNEAHPNRMLFVPEPFDPNAEIEWLPTWSLTHERWRYVPAAYAFYDYPYTPSIFCEANSNGCAAGIVMEEAILQALLEVIERDALSLWWYNRAQRPELDLGSFNDPYLDALQAYYRNELGRDLWVLDVTSEIGIAVCVGLSRQIDGPPNWLMGFGCHLDVRIAASRAVTEVNQLLPLFMSDVPEGLIRHRFGTRGDHEWATTATVEEHPYLAPAPHLAPRTADTYPALTTTDLLDDVKTCLDRLADHGFEVLLIDQTDPDIGLPVARVIVPGLYHFWHRLGGTRLYDIPVRLGWLDAPLREEEMNPISIEV